MVTAKKSLGNDYFTSLDDLQRAHNQFVRDNPRELTSEEIPLQNLLESIVRNQEHLYEQQESIIQNQNKSYLNIYRVIRENNGATNRLLILLLCGATLIPMCSRQKKMYDSFKDNQVKADTTMLLQESIQDVDTFPLVNMPTYYGWPR